MDHSKGLVETCCTRTDARNMHVPVQALVDMPVGALRTLELLPRTCALVVADQSENSPLGMWSEVSLVAVACSLVLVSAR